MVPSPSLSPWACRFSYCSSKLESASTWGLYTFIALFLSLLSVDFLHCLVLHIQGDWFSDTTEVIMLSCKNFSFRWEDFKAKTKSRCSGLLSSQSWLENLHSLFINSLKFLVTDCQEEICLEWSFHVNFYCCILSLDPENLTSFMTSSSRGEAHLVEY